MCTTKMVDRGKKYWTQNENYKVLSANIKMGGQNSFHSKLPLGALSNDEPFGWHFFCFGGCYRQNVICSNCESSFVRIRIKRVIKLCIILIFTIFTSKCLYMRRGQFDMIININLIFFSVFLISVMCVCLFVCVFLKDCCFF
jgi:hypothetical protein